MHGAKVQINDEPRKQFRDYFYDLSITLAFYLTHKYRSATCLPSRHAQPKICGIRGICEKNCIGLQRGGAHRFHGFHRFQHAGGVTKRGTHSCRFIEHAYRLDYSYSILWNRKAVIQKQIKTTKTKEKTFFVYGLFGLTGQSLASLESVEFIVLCGPSSQ